MNDSRANYDLRLKGEPRARLIGHIGPLRGKWSLDSSYTNDSRILWLSQGIRERRPSML